MSDGRLIRALPKRTDLAEHEAWEVSNAHRLAIYRDILTAQIAAAVGAGDQESSFSDPSAFAVQAHKAGFREGLRSALALLTRRA